MPSYNKVLLMGHLTRDPQLKFTQSQMAIAEFGIAVNEKWKTKDGEERESVAFVDVTAWGKTAEVINQYFQKGSPIFVEGRLKYDTWEDKNGGGKRSKLSVTLDQFKFVGGRRDEDGGDQNGGGAPAKKPTTRGASQRPAPEEHAFAGVEGFKEDDIPFAWSGRSTRPV